MKLEFKGDGEFFLPPNQMCTFQHNGRKIHCNVDLLIADYSEKQADMINVNEYISQIAQLILNMP